MRAVHGAEFKLDFHHSVLKFDTLWSQSVVLTAPLKMNDNNLTSAGPEDRRPQLEAPTAQDTHPQTMPSQMNRPGTATTHFRTRNYSAVQYRNVYERPAPRDFRPDWMVRAAALPNAAPAPRLRESILEGGSTSWDEEGAPNLVEQWIRDSNFDTRSEAAVVCDDARNNDTIELNSTIDLTDEGVGSISHSGATDENEKSNKSNSAMEKSAENENRKNVDEPSDKNGIDNAAGESANDGNPVASSERKADLNNDVNLLDADLDSSNPAWPTHDDEAVKSGDDCNPFDEDEESIRTSNTLWPIYEDDERSSNNPWSVDENRVDRICNTLWPIEEDARSNITWSDEVRSSNTPWMSAEEELGDVNVPGMDTSFSSYNTALSQNITVDVEDDRYRYCFYLSDMTSGKYGDQKLTFNQWLEIKAREHAQPGSEFDLDNIPLREDD
ncbi:unnamed protein product [Cylicocyclus nassatus]|uniref:Uncharacterized protein n=1 Tax=Cylicocyclus nassatus TaxID=53992 RepID=A0AA36MIB4_CYLNA|nr:unnamed protein product [Cylicocyclus nassatus]